MKSKVLWHIIPYLIYSLERGLCASTYYYSRYVSTWENADADCKRVGGTLAKYDNAAEINYVYSFASKWVTDHVNTWTGLSDKLVEGDFRWLDETRPGFNLWYPGEPEGGTRENCGRLDASKMVHDYRFWLEFYFICEVLLGTAQERSEADTLSCWVANDLLRPIKNVDTETSVKCPRDKIYFTPSHHLNHRAWSVGEAFCREANTSLAKITSEAEQLIVNRISRVTGHRTMWIGGSDEGTERQFEWTDTTPMVWDAFINSAKPADDTSANCVSVTRDSIWSVQACTYLLPILCEIDINLLPNDQTCYYQTNKGRSYGNNLNACSGNYANIKTIRHYERVIRSFNGKYWIGMTDTANTRDWRWTDGSIMMWSQWYSTQPDQDGGYEPYGMLLGIKYYDAKVSDVSSGLCERTVPRFYDADVIHAYGSITVNCHNDCYFLDGTQTKTWTCLNVPEDEACWCPEASWMVVEPWLSHLNMTLLQDNDDDTCLTITHTSPVLSIFYDQNIQRSVLTQVMLPVELESLRTDIIIVFTSSDLTNPSATCQLSGHLVKCGHIGGPNYVCYCPNPCRVYVKAFTPGTGSSLSLCELCII